MLFVCFFNRLFKFLPKPFVDLGIVLGKGKGFVDFVVFDIGLGVFFLINHMVQFIMFSFLDFDPKQVVDILSSSTKQQSLGTIKVDKIDSNKVVYYVLEIDLFQSFIFSYVYHLFLHRIPYSLYILFICLSRFFIHLWQNLINHLLYQKLQQFAQRLPLIRA